MVENIMLGEDGFVILDGGGAIGENDSSINNCKAAIKNRYLVENKGGNKTGIFMCCADNKNFRRAYPYYPWNELDFVWISRFS